MPIPISAPAKPPAAAPVAAMARPESQPTSGRRSPARSRATHLRRFPTPTNHRLEIPSPRPLPLPPRRNFPVIPLWQPHPGRRRGLLPVVKYSDQDFSVCHTPEAALPQVRENDSTRTFTLQCPAAAVSAVRRAAPRHVVAMNRGSTLRSLPDDARTNSRPSRRSGQARCTAASTRVRFQSSWRRRTAPPGRLVAARRIGPRSCGR